MSALLPLQEHDITFATPPTPWDEGLPLGNGVLGALLWDDGQPLRLTLDRMDLWDIGPIPEFTSADYNYHTMREWERAGRYEELAQLYEAPFLRASPTKLPVGRLEVSMPGAAAFAGASLSLLDAVARYRFEDSSIESWIQATSNVGFLRIRSTRMPEIRLCPPPYGGEQEKREWTYGHIAELSELDFPDAELQRTERSCTYIQANKTGIAFTIHVAWKADVDGHTLAWTIETHSVEQAHKTVEEALAADPNRVLAEHRAWWLRYWEKSGIRLPNKTIECQWYRDQYKFGAASRANSAPIPLQGPWTADNGAVPPWKSAYVSDLNTEFSYYPCYTANRLEEGSSLVAWLWNTRETCRAWTRRFYDMPGINVPLIADVLANPLGGWRQYSHSATCSAWLAHHVYLHWRYSLDHDFLEQRAYPYIHDVCVFLEAITAEKDVHGQRSLPLSSSPEMNGNRPEAWFPSITNYDLALIRWAFSTGAELAGELGRDKDTRRWALVLSELPEFALGADGDMLIAADAPMTESHRHLSPLLAIHPLRSLTPAGHAHVVAATLAAIERLGTDNWNGFTYAWWAAVLALAGRGEDAERTLEAFCDGFVLPNSFHSSGDWQRKGYVKKEMYTARVFTLEGNMAAATAVQDMLLQSGSGDIRVFPALPEAWREVAFSSLRTDGGFVVSAERREGKTVWIDIMATQAGRGTVRAPFSDADIDIDMARGETRHLTRASPST